MQLLSPAESYYILFPLSAPSQELLKFCLQYLCYQKVLVMEEQWVLMRPHLRHERKKVFFLRGENFNTYNKPSLAEAFLLEPFKKLEILEFYQLRNYIMSNLKKDLRRFKYRYICKDVSRKGYCSYRFFLTEKGRMYEQYLHAALDDIEHNIDNMLLTDVEGLIKRLGALHANIFLLEEEVLKKLEGIDYELLKMPHLQFLSSLSTSFRTSTSSMSYRSMGSIGGGFSGGGSFGGFGGGSFGGGGAGGSW